MSARTRICVVGLVLEMLLPVRAQNGPVLRKEGEGTARFPRYAGTLTLENALQVGLEQNLAIALSRTQLRQEQANLAEARSLSRPQVSLSGFALKNNIPMIYQTAPGVMPTFTQVYDSPGALSANAMLMWPLFTGGALESQLQAAEQGERAALARAAFSLREAARLIRTRYYQLLQTRSEQTVWNWQVTQTREMEQIAEVQLRSGKVAPFVRLRAQAEVAASEQSLTRSVAELEGREADVKMAMGVAVDSAFDYPEEPVTPPAAPAALFELQASALAERSDLIAARFAVEQDDRLLNAALAEYAPKAYLVGMLESTRIDPFSSRRTENGYSVGIVVSLPVFDGGLREAREDRTRANLEERKIRLRQLELEASGQVVSARAQLVAALSNVDLSHIELAKAAEDWRVARLRMQMGRALYVDILDSLAAYARARNNHNRALFGAHLAAAELLYATGRY